MRSSLFPHPCVITINFVAYNIYSNNLLEWRTLITAVNSPEKPYTEYLEGVGPLGRTMLLPALLEAQSRFRHISEDTAREIGGHLRVPLADITGVIEFYSMLHDTPTGDTHIRICTSPSCSMQGGRKVLEDLLSDLGTEALTPSPDGAYFVEQVECLGLCDNAPSALVGDVPIGQVTPKRILKKADDLVTQVYGDKQVITRRCGVVDPRSLSEYLEQKGFTGLRRALDLTQQQICGEVRDSGLLGRGGAAFKTDIKWEGAAAAPGTPKYIVCNADESEPGTFKDRVLLENDPFAILEGMLIAGLAIGAEKGFIYIRGEYPRAQKIMRDVIQEAKSHGYLSGDILGGGFAFDLEVRSGAGAYICGEETALFESIEGKRGLPRLKPPFPTTHGLFQKPTVINNVETFANVSLLLRIGVETYCSYGSQDSSGPWLFCLSGDVLRPGLFEVTQIVQTCKQCSLVGLLGNSSHLKALICFSHRRTPGLRG
jgi:NADH-quinone oxidoreductase subunit F